MIWIVQLLTLASVFSFGFQAQATSLHPDTFVIKPVVNNVQIIVKGVCDPTADMCPSVEPWTEISFTHTSCAAMPFEVSKKQDANGVISLSLQFPRDTHDCMGPTYPHTYQLQLDSNYQVGQHYRIENPIGIVPTI